MLATALIVATANDMAPAWYLMLGSAVAAGEAFLMAQPLR